MSKTFVIRSEESEKVIMHCELWLLQWRAGETDLTAKELATKILVSGEFWLKEEANTDNHKNAKRSGLHKRKGQ